MSSVADDPISFTCALEARRETVYFLARLIQGRCASLPAEVRKTLRPVVQHDPVLLAAAAQRLALELGGVVQVQRERLPAHRPRRRHSQPLQPYPLVDRRVGQAQPDRGGRRRLQRHGVSPVFHPPVYAAIAMRRCQAVRDSTGVV